MNTNTYRSIHTCAKANWDFWTADARYELAVYRNSDGPQKRVARRDFLRAMKSRRGQKYLRLDLRSAA